MAVIARIMAAGVTDVEPWTWLVDEEVHPFVSVGTHWELHRRRWGPLQFELHEVGEGLHGAVLRGIVQTEAWSDGPLRELWQRLYAIQPDHAAVS